MNPIACVSLLLFAATVSAQECAINVVCFAIDMSGSIKADEYAQQIDAVIGVARAIGGRSTVPVFYSAYGFSTRVTPIQGPTKDIEGVLIPSLKTVAKVRGFTYTQRGLDACFQPMRGMQGNRVIVLSTDGNPVPDANRALTTSKADEIKADGVDIVTVGIRTRRGGLSKSYMETLATSPAFYMETDVGDVAKNAVMISNQICKVAGSSGDPHVVGFDGSHFDFHGVHNTRFAFFGRRNGDLTVATVQAVRAFQNGQMRDLTYFREYGFQPSGSSDKIRVVMLRCPTSGKWALEVSRNDVAMTEEMVKTTAYTISKATASKLLVITSDATYSIKMMWAEKGETAHLNMRVGLNRSPKPSDEFHGILGVTLGAGLEKPANMDPTTREATLVQRFKEKSLFPKWETGKLPVSGVRSLSNVVSSAE